MAFNPPLVDGEVPSSAKWNQAVCAYDRSTSEVDVVSSVTETDIYSKAIAAGDLSTDRVLRLTILGDILDNAAGNLTLRVKYGATSLFDDVLTDLGNSANRHAFRIVAELGNLGAANSQNLGGHLTISDPSTADAGTGTLIVVDPNHYTFAGSSAEDSSLAKTLAVTIQWSANSASLSFRKKYAILELL